MGRIRERAGNLLRTAHESEIRRQVRSQSEIGSERALVQPELAQQVRGLQPPADADFSLGRLWNKFSRSHPLHEGRLGAINP